jgi:PAS domain S-box-containing protein
MRRRLRRSAARAALTYTALGTLWIFLSDRLLGLLGLPNEGVFQTVKGFLFVVVTGSVFYVLARRWAAHVVGLETELMGATQKAKHASDIIDLVIQAAPEAVVVVDADARVRIWSPGAAALFGWTEGEVTGQPLPIIPQESAGEFDELRRRVFSGEAVTGVEGVAQRKDGSRVDVSVSSAPVRNAAGEIEEAMSFVEDISERRERERELEAYRTRLEQLVQERTSELSEANAQLAQASKAKSTFLASMSHELRTPLNSIMGFSELLRQGVPGPVNDEQQRQLEIVIASAGGLLELINGILDLSRVESGQEAATFQPHEVREIVGTVIDILAPLADSAGLELRVDVQGPAQPLCTDATKVRQVLLNLLANAIKYTSEGTVSLTVLCVDDTIRFEVSDTGPGIDPELLPLVMQDFYRAQHPDPSRPPGTGLGLSISRRLARMLDGRLEAVSRVGEGSLFTLVIPREHECTEGLVEL